MILDKESTTNLSFHVIECHEEWCLADVDMESRVYDLDFTEIEHFAHGSVIAAAAIVLDDRRLILVSNGAGETAASQSVECTENTVMNYDVVRYL